MTFIITCISLIAIFYLLKSVYHANRLSKQVEERSNLCYKIENDATIIREKQNEKLHRSTVNSLNIKLSSRDKRERKKSLQLIADKLGVSTNSAKSKYFEMLDAKSLSINDIEEILADTYRQMGADAVYDDVKVYNTKAELIRRWFREYLRIKKNILQKYNENLQQIANEYSCSTSEIETLFKCDVRSKKLTSGQIYDIRWKLFEEIDESRDDNDEEELDDNCYVNGIKRIWYDDVSMEKVAKAFKSDYKFYKNTADNVYKELGI